jgi:hypothetical protein
MALRLIRALPGDRRSCPRFATTLTRCAGRQLRDARTTRFRRAHRVVRRHGVNHAATRYAHRIPRSTSVTVATRPSFETGRRRSNHEFGKKESSLFLFGGLDKDDPIERSGKIFFSAHLVRHDLPKVAREYAYAVTGRHAGTAAMTLAASVAVMSDANFLRVRLQQTGDWS